MRNYKILVGLLFGFWLSGWESNAFSPPIFNGTCPNLTTVKPVFDENWYLGTWFVYGQIPLITDRDKKCVTYKFYKVNETTYFDSYAISTKDGQIHKEFGFLVFDGDVSYVSYVHPLEFVISGRTLGFGDDFLATYICDECGFYGKQDGGVHPRIFVKMPNPNCTVTDPIWKLLANSSILKDAIQLIDFEECQPLFDYLATANNTH